jgi:hypothetical protein
MNEGKRLDEQLLNDHRISQIYMIVQCHTLKMRKTAWFILISDVFLINSGIIFLYDLTWLFSLF